jgi:large conductance mechanosensitive channel
VWTAREAAAAKEVCMNGVKSLWSEFKSFAFKGNMIDLAVAVVIGAAFGKVIDSVVRHLIMPLISYVMPTGGGNYTSFTIGRIQIGAFLGELVNFLIIALAVFLVIVKVMGTLMKKATAAPPPAAPTVRECPLCLSNVPIKARKCAHCTSDLPPVAEAGPA